MEVSPLRFTLYHVKYVSGKIQLQEFQSGTTVEGIVSVASNASYFFLQVIDQKKDAFDQLSKSLQ